MASSSCAAAVCHAAVGGRAQQDTATPTGHASAAVQEEAGDPMSSCEAALSLDHVLDSVLSNLKQRERHRSAQVCRRFEAAATRLTTTEGLDMWFSDGEDVQRVASSLEPWWNKHASTLPSITMHDAWMFSSEPKPFMTQLSHLTRLDVCCAYMSTDVLSCLAGSLKELRHLSFRHMIPVMCYSKYAAYALAWQKMWLGCPQLTYINIERSRLHDECLTGISSKLEHLQELSLIDIHLRDASCLKPVQPHIAHPAERLKRS